MIALKQAQVEDIILMADNAVDDSLAGKDEDFIRRWAEACIANGPAKTAVYEGRQVAVAGIMLIRPGVGQIWIVISKEIETLPFGFMKHAIASMKKMTDILIEHYGLKKVRTTSRIGFEKSQRLLEHLGFRRLRKTRKNHYIYVRN